VNDFVAAWERAYVDAVVAVLAADAAMTMPPLPTWYEGREAVAAFLRGWPLSGPGPRRMVPTRANGQLAFGYYNWDADKEAFQSHPSDERHCPLND
jgi:ketosteroid isomerase-like protein